jgi:hypothetical protein
MLYRIVVILGLPYLAACSGDRWDAAATQELVRRGALDQAIRDTFVASIRLGRPDSAVGMRMLAIDSANTTWLRSATAARGWPRRSVVGDDAAEAAFLIVQHSPSHGFQEEILKTLQPLATAGEVSGQDIALLTDRIAVDAGQPQIYGTQATIQDGRVVLSPIVDSAQVDTRRARLGLPALAVYLSQLDSVYAQKANP